MKIVDNGIWLSLDDLESEKKRHIDFINSDKCFTEVQRVATGGQIILIEYYINKIKKPYEPLNT